MLHVHADSCTLQQLWRLLVRGHIFQGFFGLVHEPVKPSKIEDHSVETTSTGVALCSNFCLLRKACEHNEGSSPGIVSSTTWCSIGQRRADGRVQHEREHCRMSVKIRRLPRKITQTWVLNSVAKFVYCVQTLKGHFDEAGIAAKFGHQKRCRG